jgi:ArsR family transcriptional regulator
LKDIDMTIDPIAFAKALSDTTRQRIMDVCCCDWLNVSQIVEAVEVGQPTVSHHLSILKDAGLVEARQDGKHTYYKLNQEKVVSCCGQIMQVFAPDLVKQQE